jgi:hypothetical protein
VTPAVALAAAAVFAQVFISQNHTVNAFHYLGLLGAIAFPAVAVAVIAKMTMDLSLFGISLGVQILVGIALFLAMILSRASIIKL